MFRLTVWFFLTSLCFLSSCPAVTVLLISLCLLNACHMAVNRDVEELDAEIDARQLRSSFYRAAKAEQLLAVPVTTSL